MSPCRDAFELVHADRGEDYGHPFDDFSATAVMWTAYLHRRGILKEFRGVLAEDIGPLMILLKVSRQANRHKGDNLVDAAGYAETTQMVVEERERREKTGEEE